MTPPSVDGVALEEARGLVQKSIPFRLIYGLFYPAVLGSGLVAFGQILWRTRWDAWEKPETYFLLFVLTIFSGSFVSGYRASQYNVLAGLFDSIEVCLVFSVFATTRVLIESTDPTALLDLWWPTVLLSITIISQLVWIHSATDNEGKHLYWVWGARAAYLLLIWFAWYVDSVWLKAFCYLASIALVVLYIRQVVKPVVAS